MADVGSLLGVMPELTFGDPPRTYRVHPRTLELESRFAKYVSDRAIGNIRAHADALGPDLLALQLEGWRHDLESGLFAYGSFLVQRFLQTDEGQKHLAYLQLGKADATVPRSLVDQIARDRERWRELVTKMAEATGELTDPKAHGRANGTVGPAEPSQPSSPDARG
jgi:hypothetical protein